MSSWHRAWKKKTAALARFYGRRRQGFWLRLPTYLFYGLAAGVILFILLFFWYARDLPQPDKVVRREGFATKIFDRNGELLYDVFSNKLRTPIELSQVPEHLRNATVAIEDKNFYKHKGFDPVGILRAAYNIVVHRRLQGGSTLTQQLVKNALLTSQRTIPRKIKEFILTIQIENKYSKDEILQMYFNESPYGGTAWGVGAASETYFGKEVSKLNLVESAILAGLPQRPSYYSPLSGDPEAYLGRTANVLRRMREDGYITQFQEEEAKKELSEVKFATSSAYLRAPHFVMYVKKILEDRYGVDMVEMGGLKVTTTLDYLLQEQVQKTITEEIKKSESLHITNGAAVVAETETGQILAMVGSKDYNDPDYDGKFNVVLASRQPGSAIKPVTYATAFKKGYTPATLVMDTPVSLPVTGQKNYEPENYNGKFNGPMSIRTALGNSINVPAVKVLALIGLKDMLETAYSMGLNTLAPTPENLSRFGYSVTLGGGEVKLLEMVSAYSAFANGGLKVEPVSILKVTDKDDQVLDEYKPISGKAVLTPEQAFLISNILSDNDARKITFGEINSLTIPGRAVAVKTGTTNDKRDNWTIGWSPQVIAGVWVGNNDNSPMKQVASGVSGAAPIWRKIVISALADRPNLNFNVPGEIVSAEVDVVSGYRAHDGFPSRVEYFISGTEPLANDPFHAKLKLCRGQDKLATPAMVSQGNFEEKEYFIFKETDPASKDGINRWQQGIDQWLAGQNDSRYHPPTEYCGDQDEMAVVIREPQNQEQKEANEVKVRVDVVSKYGIEKVEFFVNNDKKDELNSGPLERIFTLDTGVYKIKVRATDKNNRTAEAEVQIGVKVRWDYQPSPIPTVTPVPSPTTSAPTPISTPT